MSAQDPGSDAGASPVARMAEVPTSAFLVSGANARSMVDADRNRGLVNVELLGRWNHGAPDSINLLLDPEVCDDIATLLAEGAEHARRDAALWAKLQAEAKGG